MMATSLVPKRNPRIAARVVDGKALIVVVDQKQLHTLNEVGTRVWELCDGRDIASIAGALASEFEIDHETALADVREFLQQLTELGALHAEGGPG